jgi:hypothetical protein
MLACEEAARQRGGLTSKNSDIRSELEIGRSSAGKLFLASIVTIRWLEGLYFVESVETRGCTATAATTSEVRGAGALWHANMARTAISDEWVSLVARKMLYSLKIH